MKLKVKRLEVIEPDMKLNPSIKLNGKLTVSLTIRLTLLLLELFCIPSIKIKNKDILNKIEKIVLLIIKPILLVFLFLILIQTIN